MNDTRVPLLFAILSYWLIGFACACWLGFWTSWGAVGVWIGLSIGTAVYAVLLLLRFRRLARKLTFAMTVCEVAPTADTDALLTGAQFADAFRIEVGDSEIDARRAAERMMARQPRWAEALLSLRNLLVAPLGLKTSGASPDAPRDMIGIFPVVTETPERLVAGFNDRHLDFRVIVDVTPPGERQAGHRDDAGQDAQPARPDLPRDHHAVSPADRARLCCARWRADKLALECGV